MGGVVSRVWGIEYGDGCSDCGLVGEESCGINECVVQSVIGVGPVEHDKLCCDWGML